MFFEFIITLLLFLGLHRSYILFSEEKFLTEMQKMKLDRVFLAIIFFNFFILVLISQWLAWILILTETVLIQNSRKIIEILLRKKFPVKTLAFLDELVLLMNSGRSFRESTNAILMGREDIYSLKLRQIVTSLHLQAPNDVKNPTLADHISILSSQLQQIDQAPQKAIDRVKSLRRQWRWQVAFRRKASQATAQVRAQAIILSLMYFALFLWVAMTQNLSRIMTIVGLSMVLFVTGVLLMFILGRRARWKT